MQNIRFLYYDKNRMFSLSTIHLKFTKIPDLGKRIFFHLRGTFIHDMLIME